MNAEFILFGEPDLLRVKHHCRAMVANDLRNLLDDPDLELLAVIGGLESKRLNDDHIIM
ncbi:MAG: hypothetical protein KAU31_04945 [Spirochaetaceae bacterium]|nr:hypothetical protein [Spirochaetaceae bacterium]